MPANTSRLPRSPHARRGCGIAAIVIMLAAINLAVMGSVSASADESKIGSLRAETARSFYAAESAGRVVLRCNNLGVTLPASGSTLTLGPATATYVSIPTSGTAGSAVITAADGTTTRRIKITLAPR